MPRRAEAGPKALNRKRKLAGPVFQAQAEPHVPIGGLGSTLLRRSSI